MANDEGPARWGVQRRLEFIDFRLFWNGRFNRSDLVETFGISAAQASSDIARYERLASSNMAYDRGAKAYRRTPAFEPALIGETVERYLLQIVAIENQWMDLKDTWFDAVPTLEVVTLGRHRIAPLVLLRLLDAVRDGCEVEVRYESLTGSTETERTLAPHALFQSAGRWYVRAWSRSHDDFRDYNVNRIVGITRKDRVSVDTALDFEWAHRINLVIVPNPGLSPEQSIAVARDYGMSDGRLVRPCRLSLSFYLMSQHNLDVDTGVLKPVKQQIILQNRSEVESARTAARQMAKEALARDRGGRQVVG